MTYEQASARGLAFKREDGTVLTYRDGILHHFTSAITTCYTAATNREQILRDFLEYRRSAISDGEKSSTREYVLTPGSDATLADRLAESLASQGIDVRRAAEAFTIGTRKIAAGAYLVSNAQPSGRLLRNLLEPDVHQPEAFVKEQDRRRKKRLGDQIYDVTAWNLPDLYDVEVVTSSQRALCESDAGRSWAGASRDPAARGEGGLRAALELRRRGDRGGRSASRPDGAAGVGAVHDCRPSVRNGRRDRACGGKPVDDG